MQAVKPFFIHGFTVSADFSFRGSARLLVRDTVYAEIAIDIPATAVYVGSVYIPCELQRSILVQTGERFSVTVTILEDVTIEKNSRLSVALF